MIIDHVYNGTDRCLKTKTIITGYKKVNIYGGPFQSGSTATMVVDKVSCRVIGTGQWFRNLGRWSWMLIQGGET